MRYHNITTDDMLNGEGLRTVLWTAGCGHQCKGCQNPVTWDPEGGLLFDEAAETELFAKLGKDYISGLTFSGGDPLFPARKWNGCRKRRNGSFRKRISGFIRATAGRKSAHCR